jgi:predicted CoA-binding protein
MPDLHDAVADFLGQKRIAVAGVSRGGGQAANIIYKKLRASGYEVFAVNPHAEELEGDRSYPALASIPEGVEAVVIATHPRVTDLIVRECAELGIQRVWMHRSLGRGSVSAAAVRFCQEKGISIIPGSCPMMFLEPVDFAHRCGRWILRLTGGLPRADGYSCMGAS